jgi:hypothetical protein
MSLQMVGLNILVKLLSTPKSIQNFMEIGIIDLLIELLRMYKEEPSLIGMCFQIMKQMFALHKEQKIVTAFPLVLEISQTFENEPSVIDGCIHMSSCIFDFPNTRQYKTEKNIQWLFELAMKYVEIEDIQISTTALLLCLLKDKALMIHKQKGCAVVASSILMNSYSDQQFFTIVSIIKQLLVNGIEITLFDLEVFSKIVGFGFSEIAYAKRHFLKIQKTPSEPIITGSNLSITI